MNQYLVPYLMSSHPGATLNDAIEMALYLHKIHHQPEQVQDYYPTPGTVSTCMYYTEMNPFTGEKLYVAKNPHEKALQRALMQYKNPKNYELVKEALIKCDRTDLIPVLIPQRPKEGKRTNENRNTRSQHVSSPDRRKRYRDNKSGRHNIKKRR